MCCSNDQPAAPEINPRQLAVMERSQNLSEQYAQHTMDMDTANQSRQATLDASNKQASDLMYQNQVKSDARGDEQYSFYMNQGRPAIESMLNESKTFDGESELSGLRAKASADVEQAFGSQRDSAMRSMGRMGVNPNSGRAMTAMAAGGANAALATVNASNSMTENRRTQAVGMRQQAANVANGFQATSMGLTGLSNSSGAGGTGVGNAGMGTSLAAQGAYGQGMNGTLSGLNGVAGQYTALRGQDISVQNANSAADGASSAGLGSLVGTGMMAFAV